MLSSFVFGQRFIYHALWASTHLIHNSYLFYCDLCIAIYYSYSVHSQRKEVCTKVHHLECQSTCCCEGKPHLLLARAIPSTLAIDARLIWLMHNTAHLIINEIDSSVWTNCSVCSETIERLSRVWWGVVDFRVPCCAVHSGCICQNAWQSARLPVKQKELVTSTPLDFFPSNKRIRRI